MIIIIGFTIMVVLSFGIYRSYRNYLNDTNVINDFYTENFDEEEDYENSRS